MIDYALADAAAIASAFALFIFVTIPPGYLIGHIFNLWQFRTRTAAFQFAASLILSLSLGPIFTFLLGLISNWSVVWFAYIAIALTAIFFLRRHPRPIINKTLRTAALVALAWFIFATLWLMDWQFKSRLYFPIYAFDYATRSAFVHSLATFGLPAQTPLFNPGHPIALHYHYVWLLQCALVHWMVPTFVTARIALIAGAIWCGLGLMSLTAVTMRLLLGRCGWLPIALLAVTGVDLLLVLFGQPPNALHLQALLQTALAQPHYICALIACFTGFLLLQQAQSPVLAALCFATAIGAGSFVALVFAAFMALWLLAHRQHFKALAVAGLLTILFSWPYLKSMLGPAQNVANQPLLRLSLITFSPTPNPVAIPLHYFLEFGVFGACAWIAFRARSQRLLLTLAGTSILICTFVKSGATPNNDLGWRGLLIAQFALLLLSATYLQQRRAHYFLQLLLFLGVIGTGYDLLLNRFFPILADLQAGPKPAWMTNDQKLGERTMANRDAYTWLQHHSTQAAIIAQNPDVDSVDIFSGLYADRRILAGDRTCTIGFGGTAAECAPIKTVLAKLFAGTRDYNQSCLTLPAGFYTVKDTDPIWRQPHSWAWTEPPLYANQYVRIFECSRSNPLAK